MKQLAAAFIVGLISSTTIQFDEVSQTNIAHKSLVNNTMDIEVADVDGDGDKDIVLAMEFKPNVILINDGTGKFSDESAARLPQITHDSEDVALGDFDNDGDLDIIFVSEDDRVHEYYLNDGKGYFTDTSNRFPVVSTCNAIDAADFDGDGDIDLILGNDGQDMFLQNDGKGNFTDVTKERFPVDYTVTQDVQSADIDKDGDLDLLIGNENGNRLYLNDGKGFFKDVTKAQLPLANEETRKIRISDIDSDGDFDLFICNVDFGKQKEKANRILINNGNGFFADETNTRAQFFNNMHTGDVAFADLNSDGSPDIIIANLFNGYLQVAMNNGKGLFKEVTDQLFQTKLNGDAISIELNDLNADNIPDLYVGMFKGADRLFLGKK